MGRRFAAAELNRRDVRDGGQRPTTYQSILGPKLGEMWHRSLGIALASGNVDTWTGQIQGTALQAPGATQRPGYSVDGGNFGGLPTPVFDGINDSLQRVNASAVVNVPRPGWFLVYRYTAAAAGQESLLGTLDNPPTRTEPQIYRLVGDRLVADYFPTGVTTGTVALTTAVHLSEVFIRSSDSKVVSSTDGTDTVGVAVDAGTTKPINTIYFGNDRAARWAPCRIALALLLTDEATQAERAALSAMAHAEFGF